MVVRELSAELQELPADVDVHIYAGKCREVQPIAFVHFQLGDDNEPAFVVLVDETQVPCIPGRCNCS